MPVSKALQEPEHPDLSLYQLHCPTCGHTAPDHSERAGCLLCPCGTNWLDILAIHAGLRLSP